jgi:hypothetical protein
MRDRTRDRILLTVMTRFWSAARLLRLWRALDWRCPGTRPAEAFIPDPAGAYYRYGILRQYCVLPAYRHTGPCLATIGARGERGPHRFEPDLFEPDPFLYPTIMPPDVYELDGILLANRRSSDDTTATLPVIIYDASACPDLDNPDS